MSGRCPGAVPPTLRPCRTTRVGPPGSRTCTSLLWLCHMSPFTPGPAATGCVSRCDVAGELPFHTQLAVTSSEGHAVLLHDLLVDQKKACSCRCRACLPEASNYISAGLPTPKVEEVLLHADVRYLQHLGPDDGQDLLGIRDRGSVTPPAGGIGCALTGPTFFDVGLNWSFVRSAGPGALGMAVTGKPLDGSGDLAAQGPATTRLLMGRRDAIALSPPKLTRRARCGVIGRSSLTANSS
jgi:hypothetical protein